MTIYDTPVTVYRGKSYNPDGSTVEFSFCTAFLDADDDVYGRGGEYLVAADDSGDLYTVGTVGNAARYDSATEYASYCEMMLAEGRRTRCRRC